MIATNLGALAERVDDGNTGWLVEPNAQAVVATVARLNADRTLLEHARSMLRNAPRRSTADMAADYRAACCRLRRAPPPLRRFRRRDHIWALTREVRHERGTGA